MVDPVQRFKTLQSLDAQRKADLAAIDKENEERAAVAFLPVRAAFDQLAAAGAMVKGSYYDVRNAQTLQSRLSTYSAGPKSISLDLSSDVRIAIIVPVPPSNSGQRLAVPVTYLVSKTQTGYGGKHQPFDFIDPDKALEAVFELLKAWIFFPEVAA